MNNNVVPLRGKPRIFICTCGCSTFELWEDGTSHCAMCDTDVSSATGAWYETQPTDIPQRDPDLAAPIRTVQGNGSIDFARRLIAQRAQAEDAKALVVLREDGAIHTWSAAETEEQSDWVQQRLQDAMELLRWVK